MASYKKNFIIVKWKFKKNCKEDGIEESEEINFTANIL